MASKKPESESEVAQSCLTLRDPWTVARQAPPSMRFSRQEYWSGLPFPSPGDHPDPGIEPRSPIAGRRLTSAPPGKPKGRSLSRDKGINAKGTGGSNSLTHHPQFSSVTQSCPKLCDHMDCSMPGIPVHYQLPEFTQTHVH